MDKPVKILSLVSYKFLPPQTGGQKCIAFLNRYLSKEASLTCVTVEATREHDTEGYPIKNILRNSSLRYINPFVFFKLRRIIRQANITHLIIEHPYYGWLGLLLKWFCKIKLIVRSHNIEGSRFKSIGKWWWGILWHYEKMIHRRADHSFFIQENDLAYAIENFKLDPKKCTIITYGFELTHPPLPEEKQSARQYICQLHAINHADKIILFNGTLDYKPNLDALNVILEKINPVLLADEAFKYKIIICGSKLPASYTELAGYKDRNIIYAGFVPDISIYFKGSDIFINPVIDGGGIKTKLVEALGYDLTAVSAHSGAIGIPEKLTGDKLKIVYDLEWNSFAALIKSSCTEAHIPLSYFNHFFWGNIAAKAKKSIEYI